jgi:DNA-directed RNA polymerase specialized sigma24 family protein
VHQEIGGFDHNGRPGAFRNWLRTVMANRLRTVLRRQWREPQHPQQAWADVAEQLADDNSGLSQAWNAEHDAYLLERLMQLVAPDFKENSILAFRRVVLERREAAAVAEELDLTVNAVRIAQSRVLAALRKVGEGILD